MMAKLSVFLAEAEEQRNNARKAQREVGASRHTPPELWVLSKSRSMSVSRKLNGIRRKPPKGLLYLSARTAELGTDDPIRKLDRAVGIISALRFRSLSLSPDYDLALRIRNRK